MKLPPQNLEAEQGVLGSILLDNDVLPEVMSILKVADFYRDAHQIVYRVIRDLHELHKPVDSLTLSDELVRCNEFQAVGGLEFIVELVNSVPHSANAKYYADIVRQKSISRQLIDSANETLRASYSNRFTSEQLVEDAERRIFAIAAQEVATDNVQKMSSDLDSLVDRIAGRTTGLTGLETPWTLLNTLTNGFQPQSMVVLAARPSMGKSAMALNIIQHCCGHNRLPALLVSLESSYREIRDRMVCIIARIDSNKLVETSFLTPDEISRSYCAIDFLRYIPCWVDDTSTRTMSQISTQARRLTRDAGNFSVIIIDYLQLVSGSSRKESRQEEVAIVSRQCKQLARDMNCPVVVLSQLNRNVENREDRTPRLADLRESGAIEQDADIVLLLHRPDYYKSTDEPGMAKIIVAKNRNGPTGVVTLDYDKPTFRFTDPVGFSPEALGPFIDDSPF